MLATCAAHGVLFVLFLESRSWKGE
jgi:hypothetical protein